MEDGPSSATTSPSSYHFYGEEVVEDGGGSDMLTSSSNAMPFQPAWSTGHRGGVVGPLRQQEPADDVPLHQEATFPIPILAPHYNSSGDPHEKDQQKRHDSISQGAVAPPPLSSSLKKRPAPSPTSMLRTAAAATATTDENQKDNYNNNKRRRLCKFPNCARVVKSQGHCQRHGAQPKRCKVDGCEKQAQGTHEGMCKRHWRRAVFPSAGSGGSKNNKDHPNAATAEQQRGGTGGAFVDAMSAEETASEQQPQQPRAVSLLSTTGSGLSKNIIDDLKAAGSNAEDEEAATGGVETTQRSAPTCHSVYETILPQSLAYKPTTWLIRSGLEHQQQQQQQLDHHSHHSNGSNTTGIVTTVSFPADGGAVMPLVEHLHKGLAREFGWHRLEERRARGGGVGTVASSANGTTTAHAFSLSTQFETWERQLVLVEILLLSGGTPFANFKDLAHAWGRDKGFHTALAHSVFERRGDIERKRRSDKMSGGNGKAGRARQCGSFSSGGATPTTKTTTTRRKKGATESTAPSSPPKDHGAARIVARTKPQGTRYDGTSAAATTMSDPQLPPTAHSSSQQQQQEHHQDDPSQPPNYPHQQQQEQYQEPPQPPPYDYCRAIGVDQPQPLEVVDDDDHDVNEKEENDDDEEEEEPPPLDETAMNIVVAAMNEQDDALN